MAGAEPLVGVSEADRRFAEEQGLDRWKTFSRVEHVRAKSSDTGSGAAAKTEGLWVRLVAGDDGWRPEATCDEQVVSNKMGTAIREPFVNVSDVAAADAVRRVDVTLADGWITLRDDGPGIPVARNKDGLWIPYACFFVFNSGSNLERADGSLRGGTNGLGVKLTSALAEAARLRDVCGGQVLEVEFEGGMLDKPAPGERPRPHPDDCRVRPAKKREKSGVEFGFKLNPLYFTAAPPASKRARRELEEAVRAEEQLWVETLCAQLAAYLGPRGVSVYYNGQKVLARSMADLARSLPAEAVAVARITAKAGRAGGGHYEPQEWEVVALRGEGQHTSLVNGTPTFKGPHFTALMSAVIAAAQEQAARHRELKAAGLSTITKAQAAACLRFAVSARIPDADWNEQSKTHLRAPDRYQLALPPKFAKEVGGWLVEGVLMPRLVAPKLTAEVKTKMERRESKKHTPAERARKPRPAGWRDNVLFVMEGDSAEGSVIRVFITGQKLKNRLPWMNANHCGFLSMGGVVMNTQRETQHHGAGTAQSARLQNNIPLQTLLQLIRERRYGHIVVAADADTDGWMITAQILDFCWNLARGVFTGVRAEELPHVYFWQTPVGVSCEGRGARKTVRSHYTREALRAEARGETHYYKGLGSLEEQYDQDLVNAMPERIIPFGMAGLPAAEAEARMATVFDLWFGRDSDRRKEAQAAGALAEQHAAVRRILEAPTRAPTGAQDPARCTPRGPTHPRLTNAGEMSVADFVETTMQEMALDKIQRTMRAGDGLYEGTRKAIYAFTRSARPDRADAVFIRAGEVTQLAGYAHGDTSLNNLLRGMGAVGLGLGTIPFARLMGQGPARSKGIRCAGAPRYLKLKVNTRLLNATFRPKETEPFLEWVAQWGEQWEPRRYMPVVPLVVCDYASGIGQGWSQRIFARCPLACVQAVRRMILSTRDEEAPQCPRLPPDTFGFRGRWQWLRTADGQTIERIEAAWEYCPRRQELRTLDLPYWSNQGVVLTEQMKTRIQSVVDEHCERGRQWVFRGGNCVLNQPEIAVVIPRADMEPGGYVDQQGGVVELFRLAVECIPTGLNIVDTEVAGMVKAYATHEAIVEDWFQETRALYGRRRARAVAQLQWHTRLLIAQQRYAMQEPELRLSSRLTEAQMVARLEAAQFERLDAEFIRNPRDVVEPAEIAARAVGESASYKYLLGLNKYQVAAEARERRAREIERLVHELRAQERDVVPFPGAMQWLRELTEFEAVFREGRATGFKYEDA